MFCVDQSEAIVVINQKLVMFCVDQSEVTIVSTNQRLVMFCVDQSHRSNVCTWRTVNLEHISSFISSLLNKLSNRLSLRLINNGSHVDGLVKTVTNAEVFEASLQLVDELIKHC